LVKTSKIVEESIPKVLKNLQIPNEPKWVALRFFINISLSVKGDFSFEESRDGSEYRLEQVVGKGKESEDFSKHYKKMLETFDEVEFETEKDFEISLEKHIQRGHFVISKSTKSDIFSFLQQEFSK
jgi:hypothetical protein